MMPVVALEKHNCVFEADAVIRCTVSCCVRAPRRSTRRYMAQRSHCQNNERRNIKA